MANKNKDISIYVYGKWIWAGEYSVLRGHSALAFPLPSQFIELSYDPSFVYKGKAGDIKFDYKTNKTKRRGIYKRGKCSPRIEVSKKVVSAGRDLWRRALKKVGKARSDLTGTVILRPCMLFGAGLGASAVLCVLIGRFFCRLKWLKEKDLFSFCHSLENDLHGQSSGLDIAVALSRKPILFSIKAGGCVFKPLYRPYILLSYSGKSSSTKENIEKVQRFWAQNPQKANTLDRQMARAVQAGTEGLKTKDKKRRLELLVKSFDLAEDCFSKWGLVDQNTRELMQSLKQQGALAVKPTGSGGGGCVLSIWPHLPHLKELDVAVVLRS